MAGNDLGVPDFQYPRFQYHCVIDIQKNSMESLVNAQLTKP